MRGRQVVLGNYVTARNRRNLANISTYPIEAFWKVLRQENEQCRDARQCCPYAA